MSIVVRLSDKLVNEAQKQAELNLRSIPKQIEYWCLLGRIAEENADLPLYFIKDVLQSDIDIANGDVSEFEFRNI